MEAFATVARAYLMRWLAILLVFAACGSAAGPAESPGPYRVTDTGQRGLPEVKLVAGDKTLVAEVAYTTDQKQIGLMNRPKLGRDRGMIFLFAEPAQRGFYMKNTLIPLSIAYLGEGFEILEILDMQPCPADPCPTYPSESSQVVAALEVNQGWFDDVGAGDTISVEGDLPEAQS